MDRALTPAEKDAYDRWLASSSVTTPRGDETLISFKLARRHGLQPTTVIRSLRRQKGQDAAIIAILERDVEADESLRFVQDGRVRRVAFVPGL